MRQKKLEIGGQKQPERQSIRAPKASSGGTPAGVPIGLVKKPVRRQRSTDHVNAKKRMTAVDPIGRGNTSGDDDAKGALNTIPRVHPVANFGADAKMRVNASGELRRSPIPSDGHTTRESQKARAVRAGRSFAISPQTIITLRNLQGYRKLCIRRQSQCDRSCDDFIARIIGYSAPRVKQTDAQAEAARKKLFARAKTIRESVEAIDAAKQMMKSGGSDKEFAKLMDNKPKAEAKLHAALTDGKTRTLAENQNGAVLSVCLRIIEANALSRSAWDKIRDDSVREMCDLAKSLPVWKWVKTISGFSELGLAVLIGETGSLSHVDDQPGLIGYKTKEKLWKRLGLAVIEGERQQRKTNKEEAAKHLFNPQRRAEIWSFIDPMIRHQIYAPKEDIPGGPKGPYGRVYYARHAHAYACNARGDYVERAKRAIEAAKRRGEAPAKENLAGRLTKGHIKNDCMRVMTKAFVEDIWRVWNGNEPRHL